MTYEANCGMCRTVHNPDEMDLVLRTKLFSVGINPRWSPHLGRVAIAPARHIGPEGVYGTESFNLEEKAEFWNLRKRLTDALIGAFASYGMRTREGVAHIDYIVRPSPHPSADLFPAYDGPVTFAGFTFPVYENVGIVPGSAHPDIAVAPTVLASLAKPTLVMPPGLRSAISTAIKEALRT